MIRLSFLKSISPATVLGIDWGVEYDWHNQIVMPFNKGDLKEDCSFESNSEFFLPSSKIIFNCQK